MIGLAADGRLGQHLRGLLERCRGEEGVGCERSLRDTEHDLLALGRGLALGDELLVHRVELEHIHVDARQNTGIARVLDMNLLQHLADNDLDVLVVDFNTL